MNYQSSTDGLRGGTRTRHALAFAASLKQIEMIRQFPDHFPDARQQIARLRVRVAEFATEAAARSEPEFTWKAFQEMHDLAMLAEVDPYWINPKCTEAERNAHETECLGRIGWVLRGDRLIMPLPNAPRQLQVQDEGSWEWDWILLDWLEPAGGGRVFGYKVQRRKSPNAIWETIGLTEECEFCVTKVPRRDWQEYRVLAFNACGETPCDPSLPWACDPDAHSEWHFWSRVLNDSVTH